MIYIGLLRGINVGGHAKVSMRELCKCVAGLGFGDVRSLLNSGNLVFSGEARPGGEIEELLERSTAKELDLHTDFMIRTAEQLADVIANNPFPAEAERDPGHLVAMFLKSEPAGPAVEALQRAISGPEVIRHEGRHLYITYPEGIGRSRLTNALIESKLGVRGTGRNWNTVLKLAAPAPSAALE